MFPANAFADQMEALEGRSFINQLNCPHFSRFHSLGRIASNKPLTIHVDNIIFLTSRQWRWQLGRRFRALANRLKYSMLFSPSVTGKTRRLHSTSPCPTELFIYCPFSFIPRGKQLMCCVLFASNACKNTHVVRRRPCCGKGTWKNKRRPNADENLIEFMDWWRLSVVYSLSLSIVSHSFVVCWYYSMSMCMARRRQWLHFEREHTHWTTLFASILFRVNACRVLCITHFIDKRCTWVQLPFGLSYRSMKFDVPLLMKFVATATFSLRNNSHVRISQSVIKEGKQITNMAILIKLHLIRFNYLPFVSSFDDCWSTMDWVNSLLTHRIVGNLKIVQKIYIQQ